MKVVILSWAHYSHTTATIPLVDELIKQGIEVYYFGRKEFEDLFQNKNMTFIPYSIDRKVANSIDEDIFKGCIELVPLINDKQSVIDFRTFFEKMETRLQLLYFEDVVEKVNNINPDLILRDACSSFGKMVATKLSKNVFGYLTNLSFSKDYVLTNPKKILSLLFGFDLSFLTNKEAEEVYRELEEFNSSFSQSLGIPRRPVLFTYDPAESVNIIFSSAKLQPQLNHNNGRYLITKPPVVVRNKELNQDKVKNKEKIIYVSTGSSVFAMNKFYNSIISAFKDTEYQVIITIPLDEQALKIKNLPKNVMIKSFVDQNEVLRKASLFITHGGYNSICESIYHEVPMIVFPINADQFINAHIIEEAKIGVQLLEEKLNSTYIRQLCETVMDNHEFKKNLEIFAESFNDSLSIEEVVNEIVTTSMNVVN